MGTGKTCAHRRLALQIAIQLPEKTAEARNVLRLAGEVLDDFLVDSEARRRARRLGWNLAPVPPRPWRFTLPAWAPPIAWSLATMLVTVPIGALLLDYCGRGSGLVLALGVVAAALIFGRAGALVLAMAGPLIQNLLLIAPALHFSAPTANEWAGGVMGLAAALLVPAIDRFRHRLRGLTIGEVANVDEVTTASPVRQISG